MAVGNSVSTSDRNTCVYLSETRFIPFSFTHAMPQHIQLYLRYFSRLRRSFWRRATNENRIHLNGKVVLAVIKIT